MILSACLIYSCTTLMSADQLDTARHIMDMKEVYRLENNYWNNIKNGDLKKYREILHPNFSDWPSASENPVLGVDEMSEFVAKTRNEFSKFDFTLNLLSTTPVGDETLVVYFICEIRGTLSGGADIQSLNRMIHIWSRHKGQWKLIGGLQYPVK